MEKINKDLDRCFRKDTLLCKCKVEDKSLNATHAKDRIFVFTKVHCPYEYWEWSQRVKNAD